MLWYNFENHTSKASMTIIMTALYLSPSTLKSCTISQWVSS